MITIIDFETHDPLLKKYGSGAVFKYHYDEIDFEILGCGVKTNTKEEYIDFINDKQAKTKLSKYMREATALVMHNAMYDLACLKYIYKENKNIEKFLPVIHDTMLIAKLVYQQHDSYSLDFLAKHYKCDFIKLSEELHDYAWDSELYQTEHKKKTKRNCHTKPSKNILETFCKTNLKLFPVEIVAKYCLFDVKATESLYKKLLLLLGDYDLSIISNIIKICLKSKFKGIRLDLKVTEKLSKQWRELADKSKQEFLDLIHCTDETVNINSSKQIGPLLENQGIKLKRTLTGEYSITKDWLEEQGHPALEKLALYRKANKAEKDYIQKILQYQEIIPDKYKKKDIGIMFPSLHPLGATLTGRFTSGGGQGSLELNVLAISGRDEHFGLPIRELFLPYHENEKVICADFSNQEPRLQVHYAKKLNCSKVDEIIEDWIKNPKMKYHQKVADMTNLKYDLAKMLTLGLSYGMGKVKIATKLNISIEKATTILEQYHRLLPFMSQLQKITSTTLLKNNYIKTIGGRKLTIDPAYEFQGKLRTNEHKAMSKLIQGSGVDQLWQAMINIDKAGLNFILCVHDEIIISSSNPDSDKEILVNCMETAYTLVVPVVAEVGVGDNWLEAKPK